MASVSLAGRTVSHYRIASEIGRGGMGVVYRATDTRLNRDVALKVLPPALVADPDRLRRFLFEARAASALEHPNIAVIHDIGELDGHHFIAMELVRGEPLSAIIQKGALQPAVALQLAAEIADALSRAHGQGIVHRDLKPANVMVTSEGRAKVIDFGLAKLLVPLDGDASVETLAGGGQTLPHAILGTVSYMSPEQARGGAIDHRSDIFSFGVVLQEMLTGDRPFAGAGSIETLHAILHGAPASLPRVFPNATEVNADVQRLLDKCLAKDPDARYQGMKDVVVDLRAALRRLESGAHTAPGGVAAASAAWRVPKRTATMGMAIVTLAVAGALLWGMRDADPRPAGSGQKPSVAVLYFENNTGSQQLDWLRTGLTDMLVTDLSQSPDIEVLSTDRLVQILQDLERLDDRAVSFDTVQQLARRARVTTVLLGSYVKAGDAIRINLKLQDAASGRIISSERVDAASEASLFPTIDDLTQRIKARFSPGGGAMAKLLTRPGPEPAAGDGVLDRDLKDVTTSSIEAYQFYAAGIDLHQRGRWPQALPLLEKAVGADPDFALAYAKIAAVYSNLFASNLRDEYARKALDRAARLTPRERYYIEGLYYSARTATLARGIEAYERGLQLHPDHGPSRSNLATLLQSLERYEDANRHYNVLLERGYEFPPLTMGVASLSLALAQPGRAVEVAQQYAGQHPGREFGQAILGLTFAATGQLDQAGDALGQADALSPGFPAATRGRLTVALLRENWAEVEQLAQPWLRQPDPIVRMLGTGFVAVRDLYQGRGAAAAARSAAALAAQPSGTDQTALAYNFLADLLLEQGQPAEALRAARRAVADSDGRHADFEGRGLVVVAAARLGRTADAEAALAEMATLAGNVRDPRLERALLLARGRLALDAGNAANAIDHLQRSEALLPRGPVFAVETGWTRQPAVPIWYALGLAHLAARQDAEAATRFRRIADGGFIRVLHPLEYVRSLYWLGQIAERQGDAVQAREYYRKFAGYWGNGDLDRARVDEARKP